MKDWFDWLVQHEKLLVAITFALAIALVVQMRFCKTRPGQEATLVISPQRAQPTAPPASSPTGISGTWQMIVQKPKGGTQIWMLTLEQNGESLKGVINSEGGDLPVAGTIKGQSISLSAKRFGVTVEFPARLDGDTMTGSMRALTVTRQWTAKRL